MHDALPCAEPAHSRLGKTRLQRLLNPISYLGAKCARVYTCVHCVCITSRVVAVGGGSSVAMHRRACFRVPREIAEKAVGHQRGTKRNIGLGR